jgi:aspartate/methionine/tyrosine aminotransferase
VANGDEPGWWAEFRDRPAPRGTILTLYATAEGVTDDANIAGQSAQAPYAHARLAVTPAIAGVSAETLYAGSAPGFPGLLQVNGCVPGGFVRPGAAPVVFSVGARQRQRSRYGCSRIAYRSERRPSVSVRFYDSGPTARIVAVTIGKLVRIDLFETERQSTWENIVEWDMIESGVRPVSPREMAEMGLDLYALLDMPLGYRQSNGTIALRESLAGQYPGATPDHLKVTNRTSEASYLLGLPLLRDGDEVTFEVPNYMPYGGRPKSFDARTRRLRLRIEHNREPDWDEFDRAITPKARLIYLSNPNNPSGSVLSKASLERIVRRVNSVDAYLLADEVYLRAEIHRERTRSFWGMSDRVIVTSGLSKAYGIPGVRIGWIVGPKDVIAECWGQNDYLTIGPNKISVARVAVRADNREKLYALTRAILQHNLPIMREWAESFAGFLTFCEPQAGALCLVQYHSPTPGYERCERIRVNQSVLIVPGAHLGLEDYLRLWLGGKPEFLTGGLRRIGIKLSSEMEAHRRRARHG